MMKSLLRVLCGSCLCVAGTGYAAGIYHHGWIDLNKNGKKDIYEDPTAPLEARVTDLLSQMSLEEKTNQTATLYGYGRVPGVNDGLPTAEWEKEIWKDGIANIDEDFNGVANHPESDTPYSFPYSKHTWAINQVQTWFIEQTRLGIPVDFSNEGVHGLNHDRATPLPAPISIGSTWDKVMVRRAGQIEGREAKALGYTDVYAPILDVSRDPRWGRVVETYGEDPYLVAQLGTQMVLGIQENGTASTIKHFAVYGVPKGGRDGFARTDPHVAPRELYQLYLYPFRKVIQAAMPMGIMASYNDWDGEPIVGSHYFLTDILRKQFGFNGIVVSDSEAVEFLYSKHHVAVDIKDAIRQVMEAGLDIRTNFTSPADFILPLRELVREGTLPMSVLDARVADVLRVKFRLGLFDHPYADVKHVDEQVHTPADEAFALELNKKSMVLLKNQGQLLPLDKNKYHNILVTGPLAAETNYATSRYGPSNNRATSVLDGLKAYVGAAAKVSYEKGCEVVDAAWPESEIIETPLTSQEQADIDAAVAAAKRSDIVIAVVGEDAKRVGESLSRTGLGLPGRQLKLLQALQTTGKPIVMVMITGQPLTINWENKYLPAILDAGFPGPQAGVAVAQTLFGDNNPGGKLSMTFPKSIGQIELNFPFKPGSQAGQPGDGPNGYGNTSVVGALYPFGYGLSYTSFAFRDLEVSPQVGGQNATIHVSVKVKNTGSRQGDEVVQLYVKDLVSSVTTYESVLRGFERVSLKPGEERQVQFELQPDDLSILDKQMRWTVEPGKFEVMIGNSSEDIRLKQGFEIR